MADGRGTPLEEKPPHSAAHTSCPPPPPPHTPWCSAIEFARGLGRVFLEKGPAWSTLSLSTRRACARGSLGRPSKYSGARSGNALGAWTCLGTQVRGLHPPPPRCDKTTDPGCSQVRSISSLDGLPGFRNACAWKACAEILVASACPEVAQHRAGGTVEAPTHQLVGGGARPTPPHGCRMSLNLSAMPPIA